MLLARLPQSYHKPCKWWRLTNNSQLYNETDTQTLSHQGRKIHKMYSITNCSVTVPTHSAPKQQCTFCTHSQTPYCNVHHICLYLVSIHQRATPLLNSAALLARLLLIYRPRRDGRVIVVVVVVMLVLNTGPKDLVVQLTIHPLVLKLS